MTIEFIGSIVSFVFSTIVIPVFVYVRTRFSTISDSIIDYKRRIEHLESSNRTLEQAVTSLETRRVADSIAFTEILGKINVTLAELKTTMFHLNNTLDSLKDVQEKQSDRIDDILMKLKP